ncbi:MAG: aspartyl protease family protein [Rikenellaceae bacterium]
MKKFILILFFVCNYFCSFSKDNIKIDSIPFRLEGDNRIYTWCKVNQSDSLYFLIDTGASDMVINSNKLSKVEMIWGDKVTNLGSTGESIIPKSSNNTFHWGNTTHHDVSFISIPYPNERWDGVLGLSILKNYTVEINYDKMHIFLYDKENYKNENPNKLKMEFRHNVPFVELKIKTKDRVLSAMVEIDSGSDRVIDLSTTYIAKHNLSNHFDAPYAISTITSSDGNSGRINNVYFDMVNFSSLVLYKVAGGWSEVQFGLLNSSECDGMIGNNMLKRFNLTLDFKSNYTYWQPNNNIYTQFYDFLIIK